MSSWKRYGDDPLPPPGGNGSPDLPEHGGKPTPPLFLTSGDKSLSAKARWEQLRQAAGELVVAAMFSIANRFADAADDALADSRVNVDSGDYMSLRETGNVWRLRASRVQDCGRLKSIPYQCANGHRWEVVPMGCGLRLCPHCERRASMHVRERLSFLLGQFRNPVRLLTLTMRNQDELQVMLDKLVRAFARLRNSWVWRRSVVGAVAVFECTASEDRGWHAHVHVAWDGKFMPWREVLEEWKRITGGEGQRVDLRGSRWPKAAAVNYLSKYASKGVKVLDLPDGMVREFVQAWWRFRTLRTFGCLFRAKVPKKDPWDGIVHCPICNEPGFAFGVVPCSAPLAPPTPPRAPGAGQIGRASCRERV